MKKIMIICLIIFLSSCGSRKVKKTEVKEEIKIEAVETLKDSSVTNTVIKEDVDEVTYTPVDFNKPMVIDNKVFNNTIVKKVKKKAERAVKEVKNIKANKAEVIAIKQEVELIDIEREESYSWLLWILLAAAAIYLYLKR